VLTIESGTGSVNLNNYKTTVEPSVVNNRKGTSVSTVGNTATIGLDIQGLEGYFIEDYLEDIKIPYYNPTSNRNEKVQADSLVRYLESKDVLLTNTAPIGFATHKIAIDTVGVDTVYYNNNGVWMLQDIPNCQSTGKVLYVSKSFGNDSTAVKGFPCRPYQTPWAAVAEATSGDRVELLDGLYDAIEGTLAKNGVIVNIHQGVIFLGDITQLIRSEQDVYITGKGVFISEVEEAELLDNNIYVKSNRISLGSSFLENYSLKSLILDIDTLELGSLFMEIEGKIDIKSNFFSCNENAGISAYGSNDQVLLNINIQRYIAPSFCFGVNGGITKINIKEVEFTDSSADKYNLIVGQSAAIKLGSVKCFDNRFVIDLRSNLGSLANPHSELVIKDIDVETIQFDTQALPVFDKLKVSINTTGQLLTFERLELDFFDTHAKSFYNIYSKSEPIYSLKQTFE
jgi:hypothetical protein